MVRSFIRASPRALSSASSSLPITSWSRTRASRTDFCTSISYAKSPRQRNRARFRSATARPKLGWLTPKQQPDASSELQDGGAPGLRGAFVLLGGLPSLSAPPQTSKNGQSRNGIARLSCQDRKSGVQGKSVDRV